MNCIICQREAKYLNNTYCQAHYWRRKHNKDMYAPLPKFHGLQNTPEYRSWNGMRQRCLNPKATSYSNYGGRGIKVCERWNLFVNFYVDMGKRPKGMTLNRKDNNGNYEPNNCEWTTIAEQNSNTSRSHLITYKGKTKTLMQWSRLYNIPYPTIRGRLRHNWPVNKLFTTPRRRWNNRR